MASLVFCSPSMLIRMPTLGNSLHKAIILSVKYPFVDITILSDFLYSSLTISGISCLTKGSPPVILVNAISGSFLISSSVISSSGFVRSLKQSHILQRALQRYVTITVPYNVLLAIDLTPVFPHILSNCPVRLPHTVPNIPDYFGYGLYRI